MKQLFAQSQPSRNLFFFERETLAVGFGGNKKLHNVEVENTLVGSLYYFLRNDNSSAQPLLDIYAPQNAEPKLIPYQTADTMMREYHFGFNSNIFLAQLLELTNDYYAMVSRTVPKELWQYRHRAVQFAKLLGAVERYGRANKIPELIRLCESRRKSELCQDGTILSREIYLSAISTPSKPMSEFVVRFKRNALICREGGTADSMFVLLRGKIAVVTYGRRAALIEQPGEAFGEAALFLDGKRTATLIADSDADLYVIKRENLTAFFATHRDLFVNTSATLARRIQVNIANAQRFEEKVQRLSAVANNDQWGLDALDQQSRAEMEELKEELIELEKRNRSIPSFAGFLDLVESEPRTAADAG